MLHRVVPARAPGFDPNGVLSITPEFLEDVVDLILERGMEAIALEEVPARLVQDSGRPFVCFTFDDGYRDNRDHAYPILKSRRVPFAVFVASDFAEGRGILWWVLLEDVIRRCESVRMFLDGAELRLPTATVAQKDAAFRLLYRRLRALPEPRIREVAAEFAREHGVDPGAACRDLCMSWEELRPLAEDPLVTIGAHTMSHVALARLSEAEARHEIAESMRRIETNLGRPCRHFSYPYGCPESAGPREFALAEGLGIATAVTTRKGLLDASHAGRLTALPRLSLNGDFQDVRYLRVMLSGVPFAAWNTLDRLKHAFATG